MRVKGGRTWRLRVKGGGVEGLGLGFRIEGLEPRGKVGGLEARVVVRVLGLRV